MSGEFSAPDSVGSDETVRFTLVVAKEGGAAGTFVSALNHEVPYGGVTGLSVAVPAGESATWIHEVDPDPDTIEGEGSMQYVLEWRDGHQTAEVHVTRS